MQTPPLKDRSIGPVTGASQDSPGKVLEKSNGFGVLPSFLFAQGTRT